jgi:starch synthase (maltosyl-transferring)
VRVFRVDNPHTKPFAFWQWCIEQVRDRHPDAMFLSEAFTRPEPMHRLAEVGFTQSYGYFPWRAAKGELQAYFTEVATPPSVDRLRPSSWPTTPDILPWHLQRAPREAFAVRAVLAATLSPSYGIYGPAYELAEATPADNGKEEFGRSEKYELRWWDRSDPSSLRGLLAALNRARRDQSALRTLRTLRFHHVDDDHLLVFSKTAHLGPDVDPSRPADNTVLVVVNLDPGDVRAGVLHLDLDALGVDGRRPYEALDLLGGSSYTWQGADPYVELHPDRLPAHVLRLSQHPVG